MSNKTAQMTDTFRVVHITEPTPYVDEPSEVIQPGWYVIGGDSEDAEVAIHIEHAIDSEGDLVMERVAKRIAEALRERV